MEDDKMKWNYVPDYKVRHIWLDGTGKEHYVGPDFYSENGVPFCTETETEMTYLRTEILDD